MKTKLLLITTLITLSFPSICLAGKATTVHACINLAEKPLAPMEFEFTSDEGYCMFTGAHQMTLRVDSAGLTCGELGYVESSNNIFFCNYTNSKWTLSYQAFHIQETNDEVNRIQTSIQGSVDTKWNQTFIRENSGGIELLNHEGISVSTTKTANGKTETNWNNEDPIYITFTPKLK